MAHRGWLNGCKSEADGLTHSFGLGRACALEAFGGWCRKRTRGLKFILMDLKSLPLSDILMISLDSP